MLDNSSLPDSQKISTHTRENEKTNLSYINNFLINKL